MKAIAIYGKGGIGKSTVSANISYQWAKQGNRVLHVGCDPKADSTLLLTGGERSTPVAAALLEKKGKTFPLRDAIRVGAQGVHCIESGGPEPGRGCGGWGIARVLSLLDEDFVLDEDYDAVLFDVLGDVVCGGFAAPLRKGFADTVVIVLSEELMAIYAANNICRAIVRLQRTGVRLAGVVLNRRDNSVPVDTVSALVERIGTSIIATIPRAPIVGEAEIHRKTISEYAPSSEVTQVFSDLSQRLLSLKRDELTIPTPLDDEALMEFMQAAYSAKVET